MAHRASEQRKAKRRRIEAWQQQDPAYFERARISRDRLIRLEQDLVGTMVFPWDPDYNKDRLESNPAFQAFPIVIVNSSNFGRLSP